MTELAAPQISSLMEALPGIAAVLRSPVANGIVSLSRAAAGLEEFDIAHAEELLRFGVRRNLLTQDEVDSVMADLQVVADRQPRKAEPPTEKGKKAPAKAAVTTPVEPAKPAIVEKPVAPAAKAAAPAAKTAAPAPKAKADPAASKPAAAKPAAKPPPKPAAKAAKPAASAKASPKAVKGGSKTAQKPAAKSPAKAKPAAKPKPAAKAKVAAKAKPTKVAKPAAKPKKKR